jgi:dihydroorotase
MKEQKGETLAEIGEMYEVGIAGISDDGKPVMNAQLFRRALEYAHLFDMPVIQHCEDLNLSKSGVMHEGVYATRLGLKGIPAEAEETMVSRDLILAQMTDGKYHVAHLSTQGHGWFGQRLASRYPPKRSHHHLTVPPSPITTPTPR